MLGHQTSLNKFKKIESYQAFFFQPQKYKTGFLIQENTVKDINMWRITSMLENNQWVNKEVKGEIRNTWENNENRNTILQNL